VRLQQHVQREVWRNLERIREQLREGADRYRKRGRSLRDDPWTELLRKVLLGRFRAPDDTLTADKVGRDLEVNFVMALVRERDEWRDDTGSPIGHLLTQFPAATPVAMSGDATCPSHEVVMIPALREDVWSRLVAMGKDTAQRYGATIVGAGPAAGPLGVHESYDIARQALALLAADDNASFATVDELVIRLAMSDRVDYRAKLVEVLRPLLELPEHKRTHLLRILKGLWEGEGTVPRVRLASQLSMHVNTLTRGLETVRELTGLAYDVPSDQLRINLALLLLGVVQAPHRPASLRQKTLASQGEKPPLAVVGSHHIGAARMTKTG
jgi:sugar diacid utilization regulator